MRLLYVGAALMVALMIASCKVKADQPEARLIEALIQVESSGNDLAIGDQGLQHPAFGCLQIRQPCVDDYNRWHKTSYKAKDCLGNRALSIEICTSYIAHYATSKRLRHVPTDEDMARIWNGGPNGWNRMSTRKYWQAVQEHLGH